MGNDGKEMEDGQVFWNHMGWLVSCESLISTAFEKEDSDVFNDSRKRKVGLSTFTEVNVRLAVKNDLYCTCGVGTCSLWRHARASLVSSLSGRTKGYLALLECLRLPCFATVLCENFFYSLFLLYLGALANMIQKCILKGTSLVAVKKHSTLLLKAVPCTLWRLRVLRRSFLDENPNRILSSCSWTYPKWKNVRTKIPAWQNVLC